MADREIPRDELVQMVRAVEPEWTVKEANLAPNGSLAVYHLAVETRTDTRQCVLKATHDGDRNGVDTEARLLRILSARTRIPVPDVFGAVDAHGSVRAPFFLMESRPGTAVPRERLDRLSDATIARIAEKSGEHLAQIHSLDLVTAFGGVETAQQRTLLGARPSTSEDQIAVTDSSETWPDVLRERAENSLQKHSKTRFSDLTSPIRQSICRHIDALSGTFEPVLGRIDNSLDNLLIDGGTGEITAVIDWSFTLAVPPEYDLVCAERNLTGGPWSMLPDSRNYQPLVREALFEGYGSERPSFDLDRVRQQYPLYEWLSFVRSMNNLEEWMNGATPDQIDEAAEGYRTAVREHLQQSCSC